MPYPVAFEQHPDYQPGYGDFVFDDGSRKFGHDPDLAGQLAQNDTAPPRMGTTTLSDQAPPGPAPTATDAAPPPMAPAKPGEIGPPLPPAAPQPQVSPADAYRAAVLQQAHAPVKVAAHKEAYIPKSQATTVEKTAPDVDPEFIDQYMSANLDARMAQHAATQTAITRADAERAQLETQLPKLQATAAEQKAKQARVQQGVDDDRVMLRTAMTDAVNKKIDPNHFFESRSTLGQIGIVLSQAFGAYAAMLGHGRNFAQEQIDQMINNDIASQRADIEQGHANVNNALARYKLSFGDLDQAESALRATQQAVAANMVSQWGALNKSQDAQNALATWEADNRKELLLTQKKFTDAAYGKHIAHVDAKYQAASAGGWRDPTPAETKARLGVHKEESEMGLTPDLSPKTAAENERLRLEGKKVDIEAERATAGGGTKQPRQAIMNSVNANNALHLIDKQLDRMGVKKDEHGVYQDPGLLSSAGSAISNKVQGTFDTSQALAREAIADEFGKAIAGGVMDKDSAERVHALIGNGSPRALIQAREIMETTLRHNQNAAKLAQPGAPSTSDTSDATEYEPDDAR